MFNSDYKKEALANLEKANNKYSSQYNDTMKNIVSLHELRVKSVKTIDKIEVFINSIANMPKEFEKIMSDVKVNRNEFEREIRTLELESKKAAKVSGSVAGAGVATGVGVAAFGPTAALAIATTFGTASTGTAIASLSGVAATNAALAWLGGGALAVGGGGMAAGDALLALAGPVGWAIGGAALIGGGLLASSKNKKIAEEADSQRRKINRETEKLIKMDTQVKEIITLTNNHSNNLLGSLNELKEINRDYKMLSHDEKMKLGALVNNTKALSELLNRKVD